MNLTNDIPEGYEIPIHRSLSGPMLLGGVPRSFCITNLTLSMMLSLGLGIWWIGIPLGLSLHSFVAAMTAQDEYWLEMIQRSVKHELRRRYLEV